MPSGLLPHYRSRLLVWSQLINRARWCGASLEAVHVCLYGATATDIFTSWVQIEGWLQIWCYLYRGVITSDMFADLVPFSAMPACTVQLSQTCISCSYIQIGVFVMLQIHQLPTGRVPLPTGRVPLARICKICWLRSWPQSWIYQMLSDAWISSLGCYRGGVCNLNISKISILHANPWTLSVSGNIFFYFLWLTAILSAFLFCLVTS